MRIAIDAMGGDYAPAEIVKGALEGLEFIGPDDGLVLVGREEAIRAHLPSNRPHDPRVSIVHAPEVIEMDDSPVEALKQKRNSSMVVMASLAAKGELDAIISAGNTGAFAAASQLRMRTVGHVQRPGIAVILPSFHGPLTVCDAGANVAPKPYHLLQYAQMATAYAENVLKIKSPRVGLLSIGGEDVKGSPLVKQSNELLRRDKTVNFIGNVEGRELYSGVCEVAVCDGFVGNVVLKLTEGLAEGLLKTIAREVQQASAELAASVDEIFKELWRKHDYSEYGGAPLLGVNGTCIICHGSSNHRAIKNAVRMAAESVRTDLRKIILDRVTEVPVDA